MSEAQTTATVAHTEAPHEAEPTFLGLNPGGWVALAMLVVFAILIMGTLFGLVGVFLAVPLVAALQVLVRELWVHLYLNAFQPKSTWVRRTPVSMM